MLTSIFICSQNHFSHFSSSDQFALQKCTQGKILVPSILNSQKIKQELGDLLGPKKSTRGKFILNPAFNYLRKMSWDNLKKDSKFFLFKNKEKQSRQLEILLFTRLKNLDLFLYWNSLLTRSRLWFRSLPTATKCMTWQLTKKEKILSRSRSTMLTNLSTFKFDYSLQKRINQ